MDEKTSPNRLPIQSETIRAMIKTAVSKLGPDVAKEKKIEHAKLLVKIFEKGMAPKDAMDISDEEISQIYSFAYHLFSSGKYAESAELFKMLLLLDPRQGQFATALGVCHHRLKSYENALQCYMLSAALSPDDPVPLFYAYDCYLNMNDEISAGIMLCNVIARAGVQKEFAKIKERAELLYDALEKKIIEQQQQAFLNPS